MAKTFEEAAKEENGFWLQILGDHARFIHDALAPSEKENIRTAEYFITVFDELLAQSGSADPIQLGILAEGEAEKLRGFKLKLIEEHLTGKIKIHLGPTFINHMVNELEEYLLVLSYLKKGEAPPVFHELHHHLIWLLDAAGHAGAISDNMDRIEKMIKEKSDDYTKHFEGFYLKAVELTGFLRTKIQSFPALDRFNKNVKLEMKLFMNFLDEIEELELSNQALGTFAPLMADHMFREECYYLSKLAEAQSEGKPDCDPAKPRLQY